MNDFVKETERLAWAEFKRVTRPRWVKGDIIEYDGEKYRITNVEYLEQKKVRLRLEAVDNQ